MNYRNYDNEKFEENKNNSFSKNLLDIKEGRIHDNNNKTWKTNMGILVLKLFYTWW